MSGTLDERDVAYEFHPVSAPRSLARQVVLLVGAVRSVVPWPRTGLIFAFVDLLDIRVDRRLRQQQTHLCVCVPQFDRDVSDELVLKRTVMTPEMAFTTVDFLCATCPMVPASRK